MQNQPTKVSNFYTQATTNFRLIKWHPNLHIDKRTQIAHFPSYIYIYITGVKPPYMINCRR